MKRWLTQLLVIRSKFVSGYTLMLSDLSTPRRLQ
jgi:hypothetical protein